MKSIIIYYGPKKGYEQIIPDSKKTLAEIVSAHDSKMNTHLLVVHQEGKQEIKDIEVEKLHIDNVVAYSESYACITEGAIQSFLTILNDYNIDNLYLQNPPKQIVTQLEQTYPKIIKVKRYNYQRLTGRMFKRLANQFNTTIIGQEDVKEKLLVALYPLLNKNKNSKPIVIMFYGESGVGKTETAKLISNIIGQKLFRKQFSMFQNMEFSNYLFGGKHSQDSFAKDLLERESNVILIDEFDKPAPVFHSAFYQLFDEGIYEDKNYKVEMKNSIIICTSNYRNENEIRSALGDPIYFRFDDIIFYNDLTLISKQILIERIFENRWKLLTEKEIKFLGNKEDLLDKYLSYGNQLKNFRHIDNLIKQDLNLTLFKRIISDNS